LVSGASAYARHIDYARLAKIAEEHNALLMIDMAHISGLVAAGVMPSPFEFADIVTTTTHKSLRGPRGAMIFSRKGVRKVLKGGKEILYDLETPINQAVFPGHQGGPHNHTITALAAALKQAQAPDFVQYQTQVLKNCATLAKVLLSKGYKLVSGGTDNHLILVDLRDKNLNGAKVEALLDLMNVALNKNTVPGDVSAMNPGGVRMGSPALTTRGFVERDFERVADIFDRSVKLSLRVQEKAGKPDLLAFKQAASTFPEIAAMKKEVTEFARQFPPVGFTVDEMLHK